MSDTFWNRLLRGVVRTRERSDWINVAGYEWTSWIMFAEVTDRFHEKQGRSTGRWIMHADGKRRAVYLKRHYRLPWWSGWLATIRPGAAWSPAMQEWEHLEWARANGFPVPQALATAQFIGPWGRLKSFLAVEELNGMVPLHEAVPLAATRFDPRSFRQWKHGLTNELARLTRALHSRRRFHKDLYLCHFFIPSDDMLRIPAWRGRVHMIDLHRLGYHPWTRCLWQVKDLGQLLYSSIIPGVAVRDRIQFWRAYHGEDWQGRWERCLRRLVISKWRRYRRHNRKNLVRPEAA